MVDGFIGVDPDSTGKKVDTSQVNVGGQAVHRERMVLADDADANAKASVKNVAPGVGDYGLLVRIVGTIDASGAVVPVSGPLTDAQLRAAPVPVSGTFFQATQPVSAAALPLPAGAATEATVALIKAKTDNLDVLLSTRTKPADVQAVSAAALPLPAGAATDAGLAAILVELGQKTEPADTQPVSNAALTSLDTKAPVLGQVLMAASVPVTIAYDQSTPHSPVRAVERDNIDRRRGVERGRR